MGRTTPIQTAGWNTQYQRNKQVDGTQTNINKLKGGWNASTITNRWVEHTATTATNSLVENINNKQVQGRNTAKITSTTGGSKGKKKIITALTIKSKSDLNNYKLYSDHTDIYLFDSKGYEKSQSFDHAVVRNIDLNKELMIAGNIQYNDELKNYKNLANFIDLSGGVETSGLKDLSKIEFFLNKVNEIKNET